MTDKTLWEQFNLAEQNLDPGAGILYCLRHSEDRIRGHQESIIEALQSLSISLKEVEEAIAVVLPQPLPEDQFQRVYLLLEELSCLNEAIEYIECGYGQYRNIAQLTAGLATAYYQCLKDHHLPRAYDMVAVVIPQIVRDITIADHQNDVLSSSERRELTDFMEFARRNEQLLNNPRARNPSGVVLFGLR